MTDLTTRYTEPDQRDTPAPRTPYVITAIMFAAGVEDDVS